MSQLLTSLHRNVRLSESVLWQYQSDYYHQKGVQAWVGEVPYYVSSNPLIAFSYAEVVFRYLQDISRSGRLNPKEPVYILELGTGSGKFSYHFLTRFTQLRTMIGLPNVDVCYVMTDFTERNLEYWAAHPALQTFYESGILDAALFHIGQDTELSLQRRKTVLRPGACLNPIIALASYVFDTIAHDSFQVKDRKLQEGQPHVVTSDRNIKDNYPIDLNQLEVTFEFKDINADQYYADPCLNAVLQDYLRDLVQGCFLMPIAAIEVIKTLAALSHDQTLFLLAGDKGYSDLASYKELPAPHIAFHGSFSMMVNFDAIGRYFQHAGGAASLAPDTEGFKINAYSLGMPLDKLPETRWSFEQYLVHFCTKEFLLIKNELFEHSATMTFTELLSLMKMSYWDPDIFMPIEARMNETLKERSYKAPEELLQGLKQIMQNFYFMPNNKNPVFKVAFMFYNVHAYAEAIENYQLSMSYFGGDAATLFNLALCYYRVNQWALSLEHFERAYAKNKSKEAKEWIEFIQKKIRQ